MTMKRSQKSTAIDRRAFFKTSLVVASLASAGTATQQTEERKAPRVKLSCNLYSFNSVLRSGQMSLEAVFDFCAELGFEAVDPTAYYFPNYPELPEDGYLYRIKRRAFQRGLDISGTGVRNDFTLADRIRRKSEIELVKKWIGFSVKFGAPVLRVFSGRAVPEGHSETEVMNWVCDALRQCADFGCSHGILIVLQNHADFVQHSGHVLHILDTVKSEWLSLNLDIGSFKLGDSYAEIAKLAPRAATWQIKEKLFVNGKEQKTDLTKIVRIVRESGYRGYLPLETLGEGDPRAKVTRFLDEVRTALA